MAANPSAPAAALEAFAAHGSAAVRRAAANGPNTPARVQRRLAFDKDHRVAEAALAAARAAAEAR